MATQHFDEAALSKGQLRKLTSLRKSLGQDIADAAFAKWYKRHVGRPAPIDPNSQMIAEALTSKLTKIKIPRNVRGYLVMRGRGRFIVEPVDAAPFQ